MSITINRDDFDAVLFDLDGVITDTAQVHEKAWREVFNQHLGQSAAAGPFTHEDYRAYVDGRTREEGVRAFLAARRLPADGATVGLIARRKNEAFLQALDEGVTRARPGAVALLSALRAAGIRIGLFTGSRNADRVLASLGLLDAFDARVDGNTAAAENLRSKPQPDLPLACAARLGADAGRCALFEDAIAGVEAGKAGGFALVVGVGEGEDAARLRQAGADRVVASLCGVDVASRPAAGAP